MFTDPHVGVTNKIPPYIDIETDDDAIITEKKEKKKIKITEKFEGDANVDGSCYEVFYWLFILLLIILLMVKFM